MRHCENCKYLRTVGYEYPESFCWLGIVEENPKFDEDEIGCGCRYNLRTLRKKERIRNEAEYYHLLGYSDYALMPTCEYTEEGIAVLEKCRELIRHALGMDNRDTYVRHNKKFYRPYRNYFEDVEGSPDYPYWEKLTRAGMAEKRATKDDPFGDKSVWYSVTRVGMDWLGIHDCVHIYDMEK